jgi:hypothetical protein
MHRKLAAGLLPVGIALAVAGHAQAQATVPVTSATPTAPSDVERTGPTAGNPSQDARHFTPEESGFAF